MKISTKGRYALRLMLDLATYNTGEPISLKDIAKRQEISEKYLEAILKTLVREHFLIGLRGKGGGYKLSILKSCEGNAASVQRQTFDYPQPVAGEGQLITTYQKNGAPIPSFAGEPLRVTVDENDPKEYAGKIWDALNEDNKVSLFVRAVTLATGDYEDVIINKYNTVEA